MKLATVSNSIDFRDVVMTADREGQKVYARKRDSAQTYMILPRHADPFQKITLGSLFDSDFPPVYMEDFAKALPSMSDPDIQIDIYVLD